jgi:murein DD-endopeptidase MepM/ murein hydrolase activator NlpD
LMSGEKFDSAIEEIKGLRKITGGGSVQTSVAENKVVITGVTIPSVSGDKVQTEANKPIIIKAKEPIEAAIAKDVSGFAKHVLELMMGPPRPPGGTEVIKPDEKAKDEAKTDNAQRKYEDELVWPVPSVPNPTINRGFSLESISHPFGGAKPHLGIDIGGQEGADIVSPADGVVVRIALEDKEDTGGGGNVAYIDHYINGRYIQTRYMHLATDSIKVSEGDTVKAGEVIAKLGNTGRSTAPHLHFEIWESNDGRSVSIGAWRENFQNAIPVHPQNYYPKLNLRSRSEIR